MLNICRPTLLIDEIKVRKNIARMKKRAEILGCEFRPHFKTHQSGTIGEWFKAVGIEKITCSSIEMANYFARHGWDDITIAFPYNRLEIDLINDLNDHVSLNLLIESRSSLDHLESNLRNPAGYFIKIDVGNHRTGLEFHQADLISSLMKGRRKCKYRGLLLHAGNTYGARSTNEVQAIHDLSVEGLNAILDKTGKSYVSYGDTPSCSRAERFDVIDEIRPGNFVFYDMMQVQIGSCTIDDVAAALACPIVAKHESRQELVVYGGAVHLSKDQLIVDGQSFFGQPVELSENGWIAMEKCRVKAISQEHGIISCTEDVFNRYNEGDLIGILPVHSCLTSNLSLNQMTLTGKVLSTIHNEK